MKLIAKTMILSLFLGVSIANEINLPVAPQGYEWVILDEANSAFLKPDDWFVKREVRDDTYSLFISKEDIEANGAFETGLSVNIHTNFSKRSEHSPKSYAVSFVQAAYEESEIVVEPWVDEIDTDILGVGIRIKSRTDPHILVHYYLIADDVGDSVRMIWFEAPEADWGNAWLIGNQVLKGQMWR